MIERSVNYDRTDIPGAYDRGRDHGPEMLALWMDALGRHLEGRAHAMILDLGCGTGRFSPALSVRFDADVFGVDPSVRMLHQARQKRGGGRVRYQLGAAEAIPLRSASLDIVFMSMSLHHFRDARRAARECHRVLRDGGSVFVRTGTREQVRFYPYHAFFPASHAILEEVLPGGAAVRELFEEAGFQTIAVELITQTIAPGWEVYADKLATGADSVLARLDRADFERGIAAVRRHAAHSPAQTIEEPIDLFVFRRP